MQPQDQQNNFNKLSLIHENKIRSNINNICDIMLSYIEELDTKNKSKKPGFYV